MRADSKDVDGMTLVIERQNGILVDVIGGHDDEFGEPLDGKLFAHALKSLPGNIGQVGQIPRIDSDSQGTVAQIIEGHGHSRKIQDAAPARQKFEVA